jgi:PHP family Zn ribbon phosphoesterase
VSHLDRHTLFSCSDAHSLENIGRECTLLEIEPGYAGLFSALQGGSIDHILGTLKFPIERTRYYRNRCGACQRSFDGNLCPQCGSGLTMGARDRLEIIADRKQPVWPKASPPFQQLLPLQYLLAELLGVKRDNKEVIRLQNRLIDALGHERFILTGASCDRIAEASTRQLARLIVEQRTVPPGAPPVTPAQGVDDQLSLGF